MFEQKGEVLYQTEVKINITPYPCKCITNYEGNLF